jgi:general secretion pathway protein I
VNRRGFTILEVLVATTIMAIAVTGLLSALSTSLRNASRLTDYDRAELLARSKMDELLVAKKLPRNTPLQGTWPQTQNAGLVAGWRATVTMFESAPHPAPGFYAVDRVQLEVWWMSGDLRKSFVLDGYRRTILGPNDFGPGGIPQ